MRRTLRRRSVRYSVISGSVAVLVAATIGVGLGVANAQENVEHVSNGTFDSGTGPWYGYANPPAGAWPGLTNPEGRMCAAVPTGGANPWDVAINLDGIATLVQGEQYTIGFDVSADPAPPSTPAAPAVTVAVQSPVTFAQSFNRAVAPTPAGERVEGVFTWGSEGAAQLTFQLARSGGSTFCLDNVSIFGPSEATPPPPDPEPNSELVTNGTFDSGIAPWVGYGGVDGAGPYHSDGKLCLDVPARTSLGNPWDAAVQYNGLTLVAGFNYALTFTASATVPVVVRTVVGREVPPHETFLGQPTRLVPANTPITFSGVFFTFPVTTSMTNGQIAFQVGGGLDAFTFCVDNVSLRANVPPAEYTPDTGPRIRVNQVGYVPDGPKGATLVTEATTRRLWLLKNSAGKLVFLGFTTPRGVDASSGQNVHSIDFSWFRKSGSGFTLTVDGQTSHPFDIGTSAYRKLPLDALKFYYTQRSGIEILDSLRPGYGRPAGHVQVPPNQGDITVPCVPGTCDYSLDVSGGWYDAGDHGKYVVNGGISVFQLMSAYERAAVLRTKSAILRDSTLALPESGNRVPDILDEARWQMEFMLSMQVPDGEALAGMAHHKIHDENWTGLPLMPHADPQPRFLHPPSTAASLNLAATGAQCARVFARFDRAFANQCLAAARKAWAAALANPERYAPAGGVGGGPYDDTNVTDEFYWAAAELYITTGERAFKDFVLASPLHTADVFRADSFDWQYTATLGRLDLALLPNHLPNRSAVKASVLAGADKYLATQRAHAYGVPYAPTGGLYAWGSNNLVLNNMVVMAVAHDLSGKDKYRDGVLTGMSYLLGRNALNQSYVTGYGEVDSENQHSRWYAAQLNPSLPNPPVGSLAGGPNSSIQDPLAQQLLQGCAPQFCYIDHIESWSTNELTINWNSTLAWNAAWVADEI
jgi:endoglucanase